MQQNLGDKILATVILPAEKTEKVEDDPATPTNHETNFFKFLKKDFEDLSLGPIKRPKHKKAGKTDDMSQAPPDQATLEQPEPFAAENQEDAAAAWRAQRAQKSCLHSGKAGGKGGKAGAEDDAPGGKWTQLETTWRVSTLPFRRVTAHTSCILHPRTIPMPPLSLHPHPRTSARA